MALGKKKKRLILLLIMVAAAGLLIYAFFLVPDAYAHTPKAERGAIKAAGMGKELLPLSGEWEFYWNEFLSEGDFEGKQPAYIRMPGVWNSLKIDGKPLPGFGYGTFRLKLTGLTKGQEIALYVPVLSVSYELYADGKLVAANGVVSKTPAGFRPGFLPQTGVFIAQGNEADLIVHSSNYTYARNGMWHPVYLGTREQIERLNRLVVYKDLFMIGAFITLAVYYLTIFALRREKQSLLFVLLCVGAVMRMIVNGDRVIVRLFAGFPFDFLIKFDYMAILLFYPIMLYLLTRRFPKEFKRRISLLFIVLGALASVLVAVLPVSVFTQYVVAAEVFLFATIIYMLARLAAAVFRFRKNAVPMFFSVLLLLFMTGRDLMYQSAIRDNPIGEISAFGFFLLLLIESFAISRDYADSFQSAERLSQQLLENSHLQDKIRQTEMAFLQSQIKPHFLFNSLSAIDEYCETDPRQASRLIGCLSQYLRQSFDFENLENNVSIEKELTLVKSYVEIESARFDDLRVEQQINYQNEFSLPPLTIQPLVENAIRHGVRKKAGEGLVIIRIEQAGEEIEISISDNGIGIPPEKLDTLLSGANKRKSVGLINIHNRLLWTYGKGLRIESEMNKGTTVSFSVPAGGN